MTTINKQCCKDCIEDWDFRKCPCLCHLSPTEKECLCGKGVLAVQEPAVHTKKFCKHIPIVPTEDMVWEQEFEKAVTAGVEYNEYPWKNTDLDLIIKSFIRTQIAAAYQQGQEEEHQFILNILAGVDAADKEMGLGQNTKAIRLALKSRHIGALNALPVNEKEV